MGDVGPITFDLNVLIWQMGLSGTTQRGGLWLAECDKCVLRPVVILGRVGRGQQPTSLGPAPDWTVLPGSGVGVLSSCSALHLMCPEGGPGVQPWPQAN